MSEGPTGLAGAIDLPAERRRQSDRRRLTWRTFLQGSITPRRRGHRRLDEHESLIDWHEPHLLFMAIVILLLSLADAFLTLTLLMYGAEEVNPVMRFLIHETPRLFALGKMALTGAGIIILVALARARLFRIVRISTIIHWCMLGYVLLIAYEAWLLQRVM